MGFKIKNNKIIVRKFLETGSKIVTSEGIYYYMPFWFKWNEEDATFSLYDYDNIPEDLKNAINDIRNDMQI